MHVEEEAIHQEEGMAHHEVGTDRPEEACEASHHRDGMETVGACAQAQVPVQYQLPGRWDEEHLLQDTILTTMHKACRHAAKFLPMVLEVYHRRRQCNRPCPLGRLLKWTIVLAPLPSIPRTMASERAMGTYKEC